MSKTVLITGGNKGIGLATTELFLNEGYKVIVIGRDFTNFKFNNNENVEKVQFDVSNINEIPTLIEKLGDIDILVNNAGISNKVDYENYSQEQVDRILKINIEAPVAFIREISKGFLAKGKGRIVNVASQAAEVGHPDIWYGITKAGLVNVTRSFANLLGPKGIVINAIAPGPVETEMILNSGHNERFERIKERSYLKRIAKPIEVAKTILWLAIESPEYINGETIDINNGAQSI
ncbi:SDR family oxidoreductase [Clostridium cellulovorans]|uniref:Short-chain dehydrogenase/reductase SDR n=1 Tax=Clostridium cellulovorans (strain ATCC 35296 / DSM 3052 / OCM 3 / 743B) TaxID=573061 RepID=D9SVV5_CLOC7|nr:SDR family oxidoreductase [Clostridium cellulovorans]ADL53166.1 short-chain dehydrogenase/reductase SDR [Clostridium cellulovorans 743B]